MPLCQSWTIGFTASFDVLMCSMSLNKFKSCPFFEVVWGLEVLPFQSFGINITGSVLNFNFNAILLRVFEMKLVFMNLICPKMYARLFD